MPEARRHDDLARKKLELFKRRMGEAGLAHEDAPAPMPAATGLLSFGQQRLWFLDRFAPGQAVYNIPAAVRIRGPVNPAILEQAFSEVTRRHEVLRAIFVEHDGRPRQHIAPHRPFALEVCDLRDLPAPEREAEALRRATRLAATAFDLSSGPLLRATLFGLSNTEHVLAMAVHHIVSDGASTEILIREITTLCFDFAHGRPSSLPPLPCQYAAYAQWQHEQHDRGTFAQQAAFWRRTLAGMPGVLELPTDHARGPARHAGAKLEYPLAAALTARVAATARAHDTTRFTVLLAALEALLVRYAGVTDVVVGTPVSHRPRAEFESLIGFFVNTLVLRTGLGGDPTFADAVARTRRTVLDAMSHQDLPFEWLVQDLKPARVLSQTPLVQVVFSYQPESRRSADARELAFEPVPLYLPVAKFDLSLYVTERDGKLVAIAEYDTGLFTELTVARLVRHYETLLTAALDHPQLPLSRLAWLDPAEAPCLAGPVRARPPLTGTIQAAVARQAAATPHAIAVDAAGETLTYAELDRRAGALARHLAQQGVRRGGIVAVLLERSAQLLVAVLGVLKAGAAYLPIDPRQPDGRVAAQIEAAAPDACVIGGDGRDRLPAGPRLVRLDRLDLTGADPLPLQWSEDAYVIFTSGSTGRPKGVVVGQEAVVNLLWSVAEEIGAGPGDRLLAVTTPSFDIAALEWFLPLITGGTVVMASAAEVRDGVRLAQRLADDRITVLQATPATWRLLLAAGWAGTAGLTALCGGEALQLDLARELTRRASAVWNVYGPTETAIWSMMWRIPQDPDAVSLGQPIANTHIALLDRDGALVPPGSAGELHIGGAGVARGYLAMPAVTAAQFVPDRFAPAAGARLYRTGDTARRRADGSIEFLGRRDRQLKIRGYRVEPGEIEAALAADPHVRQAVVRPRRSRSGDVRLTAFIVPEGDPADDDLRRQLRQVLPEFMVPAEFVRLPDLPLNASGKVDHRALDALDAPPAAAGPPVAPENECEALLAAIYAELLERAPIGVTDDFFDLGGHSLLAAQVIARARSVFGVDVPLRAIFEAPTVRGLAARILALTRSTSALERIPMRPPSSPAPGLLSFAQERLYFLSRLEPEAGAYNLVFAARFRSRLDPDLLARCFDTIAQRHEGFRTAFVEDAGAPRAVVVPEARLPVVVTDASRLPAAALDPHLDTIAERHATRPFDLTHPPLARAEVVLTGSAGCALILTLHHLIADGPSIELIVRELSVIYEAAAANRDPGLPVPVWQYADYAQWQRRHLTPEALATRLSFWRQYVEGAATGIDIVADRPRRRASGHRGGHLRIVFPDPVTERVMAAARRHRATVFMTLLASWQSYLGRWTGHDDFLIGTPVGNRPFTELESMPGMFANTVVLRADLRDDPSFDALVGRVRRSTLDALAHQDLPFEMLVDALAPERDVDRTPLFQTMFLLQHQAPPGDRDIWEPLRLETGVSRFDVTLAITESSGQLHADFEYRTDLLDPASIAAMARQWQHLLGAALDNPTMALSGLPVGAPARHALKPHEHQPMPAWQRFDAAVAHSPEATAIEWEGGSLSYHELARQAGHGARAMLDAGIGAGSCVPVEAHRDGGTVAILLAALSVGAGYVPLDPDAPAERRRRILQALSADRSWSTADLRGLSDADGPLRQGPPCPESPAYVIFTSGSTGAPKGVVVPHRALSHYVEAAVTRFALRASDRVLQFAPLAFDTSVEEIFPTLAAGATLVLASRDLYGSVAAFARFCTEHRVTVLDLPTAFWHELVGVLKTGAPALPSSVRLVIIGGETARADCVAAWHALAPQVELVNTYGPTEATVAATACTLRPGPDDGEGLRRVPIGDGMPGVNVYLLDRHLAPVAAGIPGEIFIGGAGVAQGYLGDPRQSAERFLPDPFDRAAGARMYRTGDRARVSHHGTLEFLGRTDRQVKMRGFRVEPAEIETVLGAHPAVAQCVVAVDEDASGSVRLVGCVVPAAEGAVSSHELRAYLGERLPAHLVPPAFVFAAAMPRTATGKLDYTAIAALARNTAGAAERPRPSADPLIDLLTGLWSDVLGTPACADDSFFDLGGHSLLVLRLTATLREALGADVPVRAIFDTPTPAGLAVWLRAGGGRAAPLPPLRPMLRDAAPLSVGQEKAWDTQRSLPGYSLFNVNVAVRLDVDLDPQILADALHDVAARHQVLSARVVDTPGGVPQLVSSAQHLEIDYFDLAHFGPDDAETTAGQLGEHLRRLPFDLTAEPPARVWLVRLGPGSSVLLASMHHLVSDAVSVEIFLQELVAQYRARIDGEPPRLPRLEATYADFAAWERQTIAEGGFASQLAFWRDTLRPPFPPISLPGARPRPNLESIEVARERLRIPAALLDPLFERARHERATPFMAILTAINAVIARLSGATDVRVATMAANRALAGTAPLIGLFANTIVLRTAVDGGASFGELLARVRQVVLAAFDHQELPFEAVLQALEAGGHDRSAIAPMMVLWQYDSPARDAEPNRSVRPDPQGRVGPSPDRWTGRPLYGADGAAQNDLVATRFDFVWDCRLGAGGLDTKLTYRTACYDGDAVRAMLGSFERLVTNAATAHDGKGAWRTW